MSDVFSWRPRLDKGARLRSDSLTGDEMLLFPEAALILNHTAAMVVRMCDGRYTVAEIVDKACQVHRSDPRAEIAADVSTFLNNLRRRGLLR